MEAMRTTATPRTSWSDRAILPRGRAGEKAPGCAGGRTVALVGAGGGDSSSDAPSMGSGGASTILPGRDTRRFWAGARLIFGEPRGEGRARWAGRAGRRAGGRGAP